jgi:hypothetical protein
MISSFGSFCLPVSCPSFAVYFGGKTGLSESNMHTVDTENQTVLRDLGDGLILRRTTPADTEALVAFNSWIHGNIEQEKPDERVGAWTRDLMAKPHPTFDPGDFTIVVDTNSREIVSTLNLISQTWSYGGIPFGVGRPELVGTHPEYRDRGLVRAQFEVIHQWSAQRGEKLQAIAGIPFYYRLFGYEMAMSLGGGRLGYLPHVPKLEPDESEPYRLRPATEKDIPFIQGLYRKSHRRYLVNCLWDENLWRYELAGKSPKNVNRSEVRLIETSQGEPIGYLAHPPSNWGPTLPVIAYELNEGISWLAPTYSVIRYLDMTGKAYAVDGEADFGAFAFWLGTEHPVYQVIPDRLPRLRKPYAWYLRLPDLPDFIRHITPVLERRLEDSPVVGYSGELKITFYQDGLRLRFDRGRLVEVDAWKPAPLGHSGDAAFPGLTFLQLLFGYRDVEELGYAFADCRADNDEARALLDALFPKGVSNLWPVA